MAETLTELERKQQVLINDGAIPFLLRDLGFSAQGKIQDAAEKIVAEYMVNIFRRTEPWLKYRAES
jgi:hypothetical protein